MKNEKAVNTAKLTEKRTADSAKLTEKRTADSARKHWDKFIHNFFIIFKKKLLLSGIQIAIAIISNELFYSLSISVSFTLVLSSVYHSSLITHILFFTLLFKICLISTSDQFLYLLWNFMNHCPCVSVEKQNSSADQIRDIWYISNEFQLQLYAQ